MMVKTTLLLFCLLPVASAMAQAGRIYPEHPIWGDTLHISYHLRDASARLTDKEVIYIKVTTFLQDGSFRWYNMVPEGKDSLQQTFIVPAATASMAIRFYTLNRDDDKASCKRYVYEKDRRAPVAGAYFEDFFTEEPKTFFDKEIQSHPEHYITYGKYFNVISLVKNVDESHTIINGLLPVLEKAYRVQGSPSPGLMASLCIGYAKAGNLPAARPFLFWLFEAFPQQEETALAFSLYNYEYYKATSKMVEDDVKQQLHNIYKQWPDAALTGDVNVTWYLHDDKEISVAEFERALLPRYRQGSVQYYGLEQLPGIYIDRQQQLDSAKAMLVRFIQLYQDGSINHQYRLSAGHYKMDLPLLLHKLATVNLLQQQYQEAVINASAGIALVAGGNEEGNFLPDLLQVRASAYSRAGNLAMALEDYKQLYKGGKDEVLDSIRLIFPYCAVKEKTVEALVASLKKAPATGSKNPIAPDFTARDLQGRTVKLSDLKGKIVLMNFWGTGCGPCIGEMPQLNKLVQQYKGNDSVVFLAITGDKTDALKKFFQKRTFLYTVVNNAGNVSEAYGIQSLPVHIVIGKNGEIVNRSIGAREDIRDFLDKVIQRNL